MQDRTRLIAKPKKKKRRLKKGVRRGCAMAFWALVLGLGSLAWDALKPTIVPLYAQEGEEEAATETYIAPEDTAQVDSALVLRLARYVQRAPRLDLGKMAVCVYDITARDNVYAHRDSALMPPASCTKLLTAAVALHRLGPGHVYDSRLLMYGTLQRGTLYGTLIASMDDDPLFTSFSSFATQLRQAGVHHIEGSVMADLVRTDTLRAHATAKAWDIKYQHLPLLCKGPRHVRHELMTALAAQGITYHHNPLLAHPWLEGLSPYNDEGEYRVAMASARTQSRVIATEQRPFAEVLAPMLLYSDNILAEAVYHHAAHAFDRWAGARLTSEQITSQFISQQLAPAGVYTQGLRVYDGSGLSTANRFTARFLVELLTYAYDQPLLRQAFVDEFLPCPATGRQGTLSGRMKEPSTHGRVWAKTGTLATKGVSSLSGYCLGRNGHWYAFSVLNDDSPIYEARQFQDHLCAILTQ